MGQTANTVLPVLCMCCVLLMGLPAGVSLLSHQNTLADAVVVLRYAGSGDNCRGEHCSPASLTKLLLFRNDYLRKKYGRTRRTPTKQSFDIQIVSAVRPLYIALMRFLIQDNTA